MNKNSKQETQNFDLRSEFLPSGDQPEAIDALLEGLKQDDKHQTLLGITGSGKTYTMAQVIQHWQRPTLVIAHNKTLAAQLYNEFKNLFPENEVGYFVSFYDYYQPEAYIPRKDLFIEKDTSINDELEKLRLSATRSLMEKEDVIIVSSVSCIYGLGDPESYDDMRLDLHVGQTIDRGDLLAHLVELRYDRNDFDPHRSTFRVRGDTIDIYIAEADYFIRVELFGDEIEALGKFEPLTGKKISGFRKFSVFPATHYAAASAHVPETLRMIRAELEERLKALKLEDKIVEYHRLKQRTEYDLEMIEETGTCQGIENYSRILQRREEGSPPPTLISYFPENGLIFIDESHVSIPQIRAMFRGDRSRKTTLVEHGFRLPSALDNRPLTFEEFEKVPQNMIYVSATPGDYEQERTQGKIVEQVIRPTGLLDPLILVRPVLGQVDDMLHEIHIRTERKERVLITTLTKRMAEDLTEYYEDLDIRIRYMHSDIDTVERTQILHDLRIGEFDVLVGINLLREGLDLPEVSLVGIFDADKQGFLRSVRSLTQTCGRASRHAEGQVIMYADSITDAMRTTIDITKKRRAQQKAYNEKHGIIPQSVQRDIAPSLKGLDIEDQKSAYLKDDDGSGSTEEGEVKYQNPEEFKKQLKLEVQELEASMQHAAATLDFERAAKLRDQIVALKNDLGED